MPGCSTSRWTIQGRRLAAATRSGMSIDQLCRFQIAQPGQPIDNSGHMPSKTGPVPSFRRLRDEVLHDMSRQMLGNTTMRVADVAVALGYGEASAFIHAFSRWSGQTPDQWRRGNVRIGASRPYLNA